MRLVLASLAVTAVAAASVPSPAPPPPTPAFFAAHRQRLLAQLPAGSIAVFRAAPTSLLEVEDAYRQDSDFWYLTGLSEPNAVAVLRPGATDGKAYVLFVQARDAAQEQWTGWRAGVDGAKKDLGADDAFVVSELWERLPELARGRTALYYRDGRDDKFREQLLDAWRSGDADAISPRPVADAGPILHQLRLLKDETERGLLRHVAGLSAEAHRKAMAEVRPGRPEFALKAAMVGHCLANGATRMAYPPIVGSGRNSVILHYERADKRMEAGEMIVNDTACEYSMYAADVTRSYPVSGKFSPEQRAVYEIVLAAQKAGFAAVKPGVPFREVHTATASAIVEGLLRLGLLSGDREEILKSRSFQKLYPHGCCHWIGLNVHDVGSYRYPEGIDRRDRYGRAERIIEAGMTFTVEPGIYVPEGAATDSKWWNIGVRIEDVVLVTPSGMECLSCAAPREIAEVERAISGRR